MTVDSWGTQALTKRLTGREVTEDELFQAQAIIELFSGVTIDASDQDLISGRNLRMLTWAVCYEAAFIQDNPDLFTAADTTSWSQDGVSAQPAHENAALLAPLAHRCLRRLSWRLAPINALTRTGRGVDRGNRDNAVRDDQFVWTPL
jgi:hypothetical protein